MKKLAAWLGALTGFLTPHASASPSSQPSPRVVEKGSEGGDYVVLLHGMGRTALSMKRLECFLAGHGYRVVNVSYGSRRCSIEQLAEVYLRPLIEQRIREPDAKIHFVTHSLGGIILRQYLANHSAPNLGRVVMLGPPNHGSEIIDQLRANPLTRGLLGASARELGTREDDAPNRLGPIPIECGVIAGDRSFNPLLSAQLSGPDDGKVTTASAKLAGMRDFLVVHSSHTWLMWRERTLRQTLCFLQSGHFDHQAGFR